MRQLRTVRGRQQGMVLIVGLIILLVLTLLGLAAYQNTTLEERMAGNFRFQAMASQAADGALRGGERWLSCRRDQPQTSAAGAAATYEADATAAGQVLPPDYGASPATIQYPWWYQGSPIAWSGQWAADPATIVDYSDSGDTLADAPRYAVEEAGFEPDSLVVKPTYGLVVGSTPSNAAGAGKSGRTYYQVTSRGVDITNRSQVLLRSTYSCRWM
jgi:type IV pilus assembly protein PilX